MGADMIGYHTMVPQKYTERELKELNSYRDNLEALFKGADFIKTLAKETHSDEPILKQLNDMVPEFVHDLNNITYDEEDTGDLTSMVEEMIEDIKTAREFLKDPDIDSARDTSMRCYTILGRKYTSYFAGDMSWGDSPDGEGYNKLKTVDRTGLLYKIEELTIPSESLSVNFIKEE